jgi:hypothetical protein
MAQGVEATPERLLGLLYRFDCPSPLTIGEYVLDLLDEPARGDFVLHLRECVLCAAELRASDAFLATDLRVAA